MTRPFLSIPLLIVLVLSIATVAAEAPASSAQAAATNTMPQISDVVNLINKATTDQQKSTEWERRSN